MIVDSAGLQARARRRYARIARARRDPRYRRVLGRFSAAGLLTTNYEVPEHRTPITIEDALWAGNFEPRVLELIPALVVKKPSLFEATADLPADLADVVHKVRRNETPDTFRGIPGTDLMKWVPRVGHRGKRPSRLKCFRLTIEDLRLLEELSRTLDLTETDTVRHALRALARMGDGSEPTRRSSVAGRAR